MCVSASLCVLYVCVNTCIYVFSGTFRCLSEEKVLVLQPIKTSGHSKEINRMQNVTAFYFGIAQ